MAKAKDEAKIKFVAETGEFTDGIKRCNSELAGMRSELRLNAAQMEGSGRTTELLTERQSLLSSELETAQQKVALTAEKLEAAKRIYGEDSEEVQKYARQLTEAQVQEQAIRNELAATTEELKSQKTGWDDLGEQVEAAGDKLQKAGDKVTDAGKKMSVVSAGIAAVGAASYAAWKDVDEGYDTIITKTGAAGDALEELKDSADAVFTSMPTQMDQVGEAIGEVNTRFQLTGEALETLSAEFIQFAEINDTDLTGSIGNTAKILTLFNLETEDASGLLGLMTGEAKRTGISVDTLMSSLLTNGAAMKEMGLNAAQSVRLLAAMEAGGVDVSTAMTGLQKAVKNATAEGLSLEDALASTVGRIQSAESETEALSIATELFGSKAAPQMAQAIREGRLSFDDLSGSMSDYAGVVGETYAATLDPVDDVTTSMNQLKLVGSELFSSIQTTAAPIIEGFAGKVQQLTGWFNGLSEGQRQTIIVIGGLVAAAGPVVVVLGSVISSVGTIISFVGTLIPLLGAAAGAVGAIAAPVLIVIGVVGGLVAVGVLLYKNWDTVCEKAGILKDKVLGVWNGIKTGVTNAVSTLVGFVSEKFEALKYAITHPIETAKNLIGGYIDGIKSFFNIVLKFTGIKLPHISIGWSTNGVVAKAAQLLGLKGVPKFSVEWYAQGGVLTRPTIFAANGLNLMGGGERGAEAVAPISVLQGYVATAVEAGMGGARLERLIGAVEALASRETAIYLNGRKVASAGAGDADRVNGRRMALQERGVAL